jgi:hypothetical protein
MQPVQRETGSSQLTARDPVQSGLIDYNLVPDSRSGEVILDCRSPPKRTAGSRRPMPRLLVVDQTGAEYPVEYGVFPLI